MNQKVKSLLRGHDGNQLNGLAVTCNGCIGIAATRL